MPRFKNVDGVDIQLTPEEETARDAEEATWEEEKPARALVSLRTERNAKLVSSDWTQYNDSPLDDGAKASWATYRQTLRDLPANTADPDNPTWPTPP
tara:strand:+ start:1742 stop:2032 length:291 start_codon:yes stop_codon:yes gene_type:complete